MPAFVGELKSSTAARAPTTGKIAALARRAASLACCTRATASARSKLETRAASTTSSSTGSAKARHHSSGSYSPSPRLPAKPSGSASVTAARDSGAACGSDGSGTKAQAADTQPARGSRTAQRMAATCTLERSA